MAHERIPTGTILEVKIELPGDDAPIECLAKVLRTFEASPHRVWEVAVTFLDLSSGLRAHLDKFIVKELG